MKVFNLKPLKWFVYFFCVPLSFISCERNQLCRMQPQERVIVANRGEGTISVIDAETDAILETVALPGANPEPMYVVYVKATDRVFVGDRSNDAVVVYDPSDWSVERSIPCGKGVFHMWADPLGKQLWVNNDIDKTSTVLDPSSLQVLQTVPMPADLSQGDAKPHDVVLSPDGKYAFISIVKLAENDQIVQFSTSTFQETRRVAVGRDPHLSANAKRNSLYVPCQNTNEVIVLDMETLNEKTSIDVPGAHGAITSEDGKMFYTTNLPGGGTDAIAAIRTANNRLVTIDTDTPYPVPHNLTINKNGSKLYVTHSGATSEKVTVFNIHPNGFNLTFSSELSTGTNPFGLTYFKRHP